MNVLNFLKNYWTIIVTLVLIIMSWANFSNADIVAAKRLEKLEEGHTSFQQTQNLIQVQLSQIQTDLSWIRRALNEK